MINDNDKITKRQTSDAVKKFLLRRNNFLTSAGHCLKIVYC